MSKKDAREKLDCHQLISKDFWQMVMMVVIMPTMLSSVLAGDLKREPAKLQVNRSTLTHFLKSLIVPGWGQWENGDKARAVIYFSAEIAAIYGYRSNYSDGDDLLTKYEAFADDHWFYTTWLDNGANDETACGNLRTHNMPLIGENQPLRDQHYYENIGKYPEFSCGWDDYTEGGITYDYDEDQTTNKAEYIIMRTRSNELYRKAQVAGTLIMVNHLISAFDAALGTDITAFETNNFSGKIYINPLDVVNSIGLEVKF